jgi:hypothetical protein
LAGVVEKRKYTFRQSLLHGCITYGHTRQFRNARMRVVSQNNYSISSSQRGRSVTANDRESEREVAGAENSDRAERP